MGEIPYREGRNYLHKERVKEMATIHLGDCLNGCEVCAKTYHEVLSIQESVCDACGINLEKVGA
jgi:hypothetical protein